MAEQKMKIDIGTSFRGDGVNRAIGSMDNLQKASTAASRSIGSMARTGSKISAMFGGMPGPIGKAMQSLEGLTQAFGMLKSGMGGVLAVGAAVLSWMLKKQKAYEDTKAAAIAAAKAERQARIDAENEATRREMEAEEKRRTERKKAYDERMRQLDELSKANWALYEAEKGRQSAGNNLKLQRLREDNAQATEAETDPHRKAYVEAEGKLKEIEFTSTANAKLAKQILREEEAKLKGLSKKIGYSETPHAEQLLTRQIEAQLKRVETARTNARAAAERGDADVRAAKELVDEMKLEMEAAQARAMMQADEAERQRLIEESEAYNRMIDEQLRAQREQDLRNQAEIMEEGGAKYLEDLDRNIKRIRGDVEKIQRERQEAERGMEYENSNSGNGLNGGNRYGGYNYNRDENGNLRPEDLARANRMAQGQARDLRSQNMGANRAAQFDREGQALWDRAQQGKNLRQDEWDRLDNWRKWKNQGKEGEKEKALGDAQAEKDQALKDINTSVTEINQRLQELGLK